MQSGLQTSAVAILAFGLIGMVMGLPRDTLAHEDHAHFSAGEPGNPQEAARTVKVTMMEDDKRMLFDPAVIEVRLGEQVRFILFNEGSEYHEFVLATRAENREHAEFMKKFPNMEHNDVNAKRLSALDSGELVWKFTR
ncbi:MAG TPA: hypothetical protein VGU90_16940, partial [Terriglobales bacterium]|nr:hypothetical protein [Terriglobales bacterium]